VTFSQIDKICEKVRLAPINVGAPRHPRNLSPQDA
jgi:hypothetical protein